MDFANKSTPHLKDFRNTLLKACFPILDFCWPGMRPQRQNIVADGLGWLASSRSVEWVAAHFRRRASPNERFSRRERACADHHVGQPKQRVELMAVFGQSPIPHFPMAE